MCKWCPHLPALPADLQGIATRVEHNIRASIPVWLRGSQLETDVVRWAVHGLHTAHELHQRELGDALRGVP